VQTPHIKKKDIPLPKLELACLIFASTLVSYSCVCQQAWLFKQSIAFTSTLQWDLVHILEHSFTLAHVFPPSRQLYWCIYIQMYGINTNCNYKGFRDYKNYEAELFDYTTSHFRLYFFTQTSPYHNQHTFSRELLSSIETTTTQQQFSPSNATSKSQ
jgi:hypothetical protein